MLSKNLKVPITDQPPYGAPRKHLTSCSCCSSQDVISSFIARESREGPVGNLSPIASRSRSVSASSLDDRLMEASRGAGQDASARNSTPMAARRKKPTMASRGGGGGGAAVGVDVPTANTDWAGRPRPSKLKRKNTPHPSTMMGTHHSEGAPTTERAGGTVPSKGRKGTSLDAGSSSSSTSSSSSSRNSSKSESGGDSSARKPGAKSRPSGGIQFDLPASSSAAGGGEKAAPKPMAGSKKLQTKPIEGAAAAASTRNNSGRTAADSKREKVAAVRQRREEQQRARAQRLSGSSQVSSSARTSRSGVSSKRSSSAGGVAR